MGRGREGGKAGWGIGQTPQHFRASWLGRDGRLRPPAAWGAAAGGHPPLLLAAFFLALALPRWFRDGAEGGGLDSPGPPRPSSLAGRHLSPVGLERRRHRLLGSVTLLPFP